MATTDTIIPAVTTVAPYYDDYNEDKGFHRILFRPGYGVQARELTQLQDILQKQIERLGENIFQNGSAVVGGQITYQAGIGSKAQYINLQSQYANTNIVANSFVGNIIYSTNTASSNVTAKAIVLSSLEATTNTPPTLIVTPLNSAVFYSNDTIAVVNNANLWANVASSNATGNSSIVSIDQGVYFINGFFVLVEPQTIILDPYDSSPTCLVGLEFDDAIIDETEDSSLLDPALGASAYQAPGAVRYQILLNLSTRTLTSQDLSKFITLMTFELGVLQNTINYPAYSVLGDVLAQRTFDQSGNFTVKPFVGQLQNSVPALITGTVTVSTNTNIVSGNGTYFSSDAPVNSVIIINNQYATVNSVVSNTSLTTSNNFPNGANNVVAFVQNPNNFGFKLSPGKGYICGYDYQTITPTILNVRRGIDTDSTTNYGFYNPLGNYLYVNTLQGIPDVTSLTKLDIHSVPTESINYTNTNTYATTVIGSTRIRALEYQSTANTLNANSTIYIAYLFNVNVASNTYTFGSANAFSQYGVGPSYTVAMNIDNSSKDETGNTILTDTNFNSLVYPFPQSTIAPSSITNVEYTYRKMQSGVYFANGVASLSLSLPEVFPGSGALSDLEKEEFWIVTIASNGTSIFANSQIIPMSASFGRSITISPTTTATLNANVANNFYANVLYTVQTTGTAPGPRSKTELDANLASILTTGGTVIGNTNTTIYLTNGQIVVSGNPNTGFTNILTSATVPQPLYIADIIRLRGVYDFNGQAITSANLTSAGNVTSNFTLDNGQRDNSYDLGSLSLNIGAPLPKGPVLIFVDYYSQSGTSGYLDVDSYPNANTQSGYNNIPAYKSPTTGVTYELRDSLDWRPIRTNATDSGAFDLSSSPPRILEPGYDFECNFSYYLPRIDLLLLTKDLLFKVKRGIPSLAPSTPVYNSTDMLLYTLDIPAYTFEPTDVNVIYQSNRRYTMADVGQLDRRIQNLEYYAALTQLESLTTSTTYVNSLGLTLFQNGIVTDAFTGQNVGDVNAYDYACSMDFTSGTLHPMFYSENAEFWTDDSDSTNFNDNGTQVTMGYTLDESFVVQPYASTEISVNPFNFVSWVGVMKLLPDTDTWYDTQTAPDVLVNLDGTNNAYQVLDNFINNTGYGTQYGDWQTNWSGVTASATSTSSSQFVSGDQIIQENITTVTNTETTQQSRSVSTAIAGTDTIQQSIGTFVVSSAVEPYIRGDNIIVVSVDLKPFTVVYPFFDTKPVQGYWVGPLVIGVDPMSIVGTYDYKSLNEVVSSTSGGSGILAGGPEMASMSANTIYSHFILASYSGIFNVGDVISGTSSTGNTFSANVTSIFRSSDKVSANNANTYQINLANSAPQNANLILGHTINIAQGTGAGQIGVIVGYNVSSNVATVSSPWNTPPDTTSVYSIGAPQTSPSGRVAGNLIIPGGTFLAGSISVVLTSDPNNSSNNTETYAQTTYYAQGILDTVENVIVSTRLPTLVYANTIQTQTLTSTYVASQTVSDTVIGYVAQPQPPQAPDGAEGGGF